MELIVAGMLSLIVIAAMGKLDVTRILLTKQTSDTTSLQASTERAMLHLSKRIGQADRVILSSPTNIQVRTVLPPPGVPDPAYFDDAASYLWHQYTYDAGTQHVLFYDGGCGSPQVIGRNLTDMILAFEDTETNLLRITLEATDPATQDSITASTEVAMRAVVAEGVGAGGGDSGSGLDGFGVSPPPAPCS